MTTEDKGGSDPEGSVVSERERILADAATCPTYRWNDEIAVDEDSTEEELRQDEVFYQTIMSL